jgi:hypothetical protein
MCESIKVYVKVPYSADLKEMNAFAFQDILIMTSNLFITTLKISSNELETFGHQFKLVYVLH